MSIKAKRIKELSGFRGDAALYELSEPVKGYAGDETSFVVISAVNDGMWVHETYIFAANKDGEITEWCEMDGSMRGVTDHNAAIENAGWELAD